MTLKNDDVHREGYAAIKFLLGLYFALLLLEGVLRKWVFPAYSDLIYICRDPLVLVIYALAWWAGVFPRRPCIVILWLLTLLSLLFSLHNDVPVLVTAFGLRTNYLHLPLIFVMAAVLDIRDVKAYGRWCMILSVPVFFLMLAQFNAEPNGWLNVGAGGVEGGQLLGAMGKIRPPGPYSFISGVILWFSLTSAYVLHGWLEPGAYRRTLLFVGTAATVAAVPISISRALLLGVIIVAVFSGAVLLRLRRRIPRMFGLAVAGVTLAAVMINTIYVRAFLTRWDEAAEVGGRGFSVNVVQRFFDSFLDPFVVAVDAPMLGNGIGMGTVAGARLMTGKYDFLLAESELARIVLELGPFLGFAFIGWRVWLVGDMIWRSWNDIQASGDVLPWLLAGAVFLNVLMGQWGQATSLGYAVFGSGLVLAALNKPDAPPT